MSRTDLLLASLGAVLLLSPVLLAAAVAPAVSELTVPAMTAPAADADEPGRTEFPPTRVRPGVSFARQLAAATAADAERLAELQARFATATPGERARLVRDIEALKLERDRRLVRVQLERAQRDGRTALVTRLERRMAGMATAVRAGKAGAR